MLTLTITTFFISIPSTTINICGPTAFSGIMERFMSSASHFRTRRILPLLSTVSIVKIAALWSFNMSISILEVSYCKTIQKSTSLAPIRAVWVKWHPVTTIFFRFFSCICIALLIVFDTQYDPDLNLLQFRTKYHLFKKTWLFVWALHHIQSIVKCMQGAHSDLSTSPFELYQKVY